MIETSTGSTSAPLGDWAPSPTLTGIDSLTWGTTHYCYPGCWQHSSVVYISGPVGHEHDFSRVKGERLLFCRRCGETKALAKGPTL